ncbi:MAG: hypothetical protein U9N30_04635 [Campylobacterota bacterium]|nr:hypothetical protein [Campylobacterota bacterium]
MHIYIYGSKEFKKAVHSALDHGNVKFRMDDKGTIEDLDSLETLKMTIEQEPENIYLIDHEKIIDKKSLNSKIKFLTPKDGIEKEFLDDHGIEDVSIDSIEDLPKYVIRKLEAMHLTDIFDDSDEKNSAQEDMVGISENEIDAISDILEDIENIAEDSSQNAKRTQNDFGLGDDLKDLLSYDEDQQEDEPEDIAQDDDMAQLMDISPKQDEQNENDEKPTIQGTQTMEEISELDNVEENDMMAALDGMDMSATAPVVSTPLQTSSKPISIDASNVNDLASLLTQLLNNKTLEITVKIKE